jgi:CrcB protein
MTLLAIAATCAAGGLGAAARFLLDGAVRARTRSGLPLATMIINVTGSFLLGVLAGLVAARVVTQFWMVVLGTGFLGGYTTFSTASFETVRLLEDRRLLAAVATGLGLLAACVASAWLGFRCGSALSPQP